MQSIALEAFQFAANNGPLPFEPFGDKDAPLLAEIHSVLKENGMEDRFGVTLVNKNFALAADEVTMETSDHGERLSVLEVMKEGDLNVSESLPTNWYFRSEGPARALRCLGYCDYKNWTHTNRHTGRRGFRLEM